MRAAALRGFVLLLFAGLLAGCPGSDPPGDACTPVPVDASCTPAYEPTYEKLFTTTFNPGCVKSGGTCHSSVGHQGGLVFEDIDDSYRRLHDTGVVKDGDPACSPIVARVTSTNGKIRMPPAVQLSAGEQCAIERWIAAGAKR
jgi:hypothetical protein